MNTEYTTTILPEGFEVVIRMELAEGSRDAQAWFDFVKNRSPGPRELVFEDDKLIIRPVSEEMSIPEGQSKLEAFQ